MKLRHRYLCAILSGLLLPFCHSPIGVWPLLFPVLGLLFYAVTDTTPRHALYLGVLQGTIGHGITLSWFTHIFGLGALTLYVMLGIFNGFACLFVNRTRRHFGPGLLASLIAAAGWTALEFYRCEVFVLRFPWATPGTAIGPTWLSPVLGVAGASFCIITAAHGILARRSRMVAALLTLLLLGLGFFRPPRWPTPTAEPIRVAAIQNEQSNLDAYLRPSRELPPVDLILWPEYALPYDVRKAPNDFQRLLEFTQSRNTLLVLGTKTVIGPGAKDWHNTALVLGPGGVLGEHYKARPVHFFNDGIPATRIHPMKTPLGLLAAPICFDTDFSLVIQQYVRNGAEFLVIPTFDAIEWSAKQHLQHAELYRLRAAENRRWIVSAASSGVSQIIDPHGQVHHSLPPLEEGVLIGTVAREKALTFYTRIGWAFPWLTVAVTALAIGSLVFQKQAGTLTTRAAKGTSTL